MKKNRLVLIIMLFAFLSSLLSQEKANVVETTPKWIFCRNDNFDILWKIKNNGFFAHNLDESHFMGRCSSPVPTVILGSLQNGDIIWKRTFDKELFDCGYKWNKEEGLKFKVIIQKDTILENHYIDITNGETTKITKTIYSMNAYGACPVPDPSDSLIFIITTKNLFIIDSDLKIHKKITLNDDEYVQGTVYNNGIICSAKGMRAIDRKTLKEAWNRSFDANIKTVVLGGKINITLANGVSLSVSYKTGELLL